MKTLSRLALILCVMAVHTLSMASALDDFIKFTGTKITGNTILKFSDSTPEECATHCRSTENAGWCRSFDFTRSTSTCYLQSETMDTWPLDVGDDTSNAYRPGKVGYSNDYYHLRGELDPMAKFVRVRRAAIFGHNTKRLHGLTLAQCAQACLNESWCRSFDRGVLANHKDFGVCDLSNMTGAEVGGLKENYVDDPYEHFQRVPQVPRENPVVFNGRKRHVLFVGFDGLRGDSINCEDCFILKPETEEKIRPQNLLELISTGAFHNNVLAGGEHQPTKSGPGWSTLFTGFWADKHKILSNDLTYKETVVINAVDDPDQAANEAETTTITKFNRMEQKHIFDKIKLRYPTATTAVIGDWENLVLNLKPTLADYVKPVRYKQSHVTAAKAVEMLQMTHPPTAMFVYLHKADIHSLAWGPTNPYYRSQIQIEDDMLGQILNALVSRPSYQNEDWLIVAASDHGGIEKRHGGQSPEERNAFVIFNDSFRKTTASPICSKGSLHDRPMLQKDVAMHILKYMDIENDTDGVVHLYCDDDPSNDDAS